MQPLVLQLTAYSDAPNCGITTHARGVNYNRNMFIVKATDGVFLF